MHFAFATHRISPGTCSQQEAVTMAEEGVELRLAAILTADAVCVLRMIDSVVDGP